MPLFFSLLYVDAAAAFSPPLLLTPYYLRYGAIFARCHAAAERRAMFSALLIAAYFFLL